MTQHVLISGCGECMASAWWAAIEWGNGEKSGKGWLEPQCLGTGLCLIWASIWLLLCRCRISFGPRERTRGSDGKHKGFNDKDKFKSLWVTYSGMESGDCYRARGPGALQCESWLWALPSWFEPSSATHCVTLDKAQFAHLYNGHGTDDTTNLMVLLYGVEMIPAFHSFWHSGWL